MKFSVVIATINRKDELRRTIEAYRRQSHPDVEIVVIDNGSTDGTREMMQGEFGDLLYEWLPYNMGTHAINIGFAKASGDVFWLSNNDSYPESSEALAQVATLLDRFPEVHIVGTEDIEVRDGNRVYQWHPLPVDKSAMPPDGFPSNLFHGTGAAVRRSVVDDIGGFWDVFVFEELDFCTRAIARGYSVRYVPAIRTLHFASPRSRVPIERWIAAAKNLTRYHWRHFPLAQALLRTILYYPYFLLQGLAYPAAPSALFDVIFGIPAEMFRTIRRERRPIPRDKVAAVTLGQGALRPMLRYARSAVSRRLLRRRQARTHTGNTG